ncbi:MAG: HD domain-containing protein [Candidatus Uhrbacteria bacterium]|nr:HD domain-containing protein [Candidatus Uhrbacteria bacterium]
MKNTQNNSEQLTKLAEDLVHERIKGTRKGLPNEPNYRHSFRVREMVRDCHLGLEKDDDLFIAALLHDIMEDGSVSFEELAKMGFTKRTIELVRLCSHDMSIEDKTERWIGMIARLMGTKNDDAWRIKLADLADNLAQSAGLSLENRMFMIEVKAPLLLRLAHVQNSAYYMLKDEMEKQKTELAKTREAQEDNGQTLKRLAEHRKAPTQCHLWKKEQVTNDDLYFVGFDILYTFYDDGHLSRRLIKCKECGQLYFKEFYEEIDWADGDDPQYVTCIPVSDEPEAWLISKTSIMDILRFQPCLRSDWPKGGIKTTYWVGRNKENQQ